MDEARRTDRSESSRAGRSGSRPDRKVPDQAAELVFGPERLVIAPEKLRCGSETLIIAPETLPFRSETCPAGSDRLAIGSETCPVGSVRLAVRPEAIPASPGWRARGEAPILAHLPAPRGSPWGPGLAVGSEEN